MKSVVYCCICDDMQEFVSIWSEKYFNNDIKNSRQLVWSILIIHSEKQWYELMELSEQELYETLMTFANNNKTKVLYPN